MCRIVDNIRPIGGSTCALAVGTGLWFAALGCSPTVTPAESKHQDKPSATTVAVTATPQAAAPTAQATTSPAPAEEANLPPAGKSDHVMFGGAPDRNMVNLIDTSIPGKFDPAEDTLWTAQLGNKSYGGPTIARGHIYVGTNNGNPRNSRDRDPANGNAPRDKGVIMCFEEATGKFLWQSIHDKLESGIVNDWEHEGICSTPTAVGNRVYYSSNRCTVVCADPDGCTKSTAGAEKQKYHDPTDSKILWEFDMIKNLDVFPHNMTDCSPLVVDDVVFVITANGVDEGHKNIPSPLAPSFIALSRQTGKLIWKSSLPGKNIMHGQWSNPSYGVIGGVKQVLFPGGDGWLYALNPATGELLWKFDANPKDSKYELGGKGTRSDFIGSPVIHGGKVYIGTGQDPEHYEGIGHFWCIDPTKATKPGMDLSPDLVTDGSVFPPKTKPNPDSGAVWQFGGEEKHAHAERDYAFGRTMSTACIVDDVLYISELAGFLHCLDPKTGHKYWQADIKSGIWGSPYYADGKIYIGNEDGDLYVFRHDKKPKDLDEVALAALEPNDKAAGDKRKEVRKQVAKEYLIAKIDMGAPIRSTPIVANGVLYILTEKSLIAIKKK